MTVLKLVKANDPAELELAVLAKTAEGFDLQGTLSTSDVSVIGQWMVNLPCLNEYKLIIVADLDEYERLCRDLHEAGRDSWHGTQRRGGKILQWMMREKPIAIKQTDFIKHIVLRSDRVTSVNYHWVERGGSLPYPIVTV